MRYHAALLGCVIGLGAVCAHADDRSTSAPAASAIRLPHFGNLSVGGLSYNGEAKGVVMPLNADNTWALGVGNLDARDGLDGSPGHGFHLNATPTPGAILQHRF